MTYYNQELHKEKEDKNKSQLNLFSYREKEIKKYTEDSSINMPNIFNISNDIKIKWPDQFR